MPLLLPDRPVCFVNLVVLDATLAIDQQLQREFKDIPKPIHQVAAKLATTAWANPERVAEVLQTELPKDLMKKLDAHGITAVAETTFWEGPYLVVQLQVQSVDAAALVEARSKTFYDEWGDVEEEAHMSRTMALRLKSCLQFLLSCLGIRIQSFLQNNFLPYLVQLPLERALDKSIAAKLQRRGFHASSKVLSQRNQARYFFETLHEVRQAYRPFCNFVETFEVAHHERVHVPARKPCVVPPASPISSRKKLV